MSTGASRARLLELRAALEAARAGREVLDQKRKLLLEAVRRAAGASAERRAAAAARLGEARGLLARARVAAGARAVDAALLAQPPAAAVTERAGSMLGVPLVRLALAAPPFRPRYGPLGTPAALDGAGQAWAAALCALVALADAESAERGLRQGLARTARRLAAIEDVLIPDLTRQIRGVADALEEEERDDALRRRRWLAGPMHGR